MPSGDSIGWPLEVEWGDVMIAGGVVSTRSRGFGGVASASGGLLAASKVDLATFEGAALFADSGCAPLLITLSKYAGPKVAGPKVARISRAVVSRVVRWRVGEGCLAPRRDPELGPSDRGYRGSVSLF